MAEDSGNKASTTKPNTNAEGQFDRAANSIIDSEELVAENSAEIRAQEAPENQAATKRASEK